MANPKKLALDYHEYPTPGKIAVLPTKACETAYDLSLAYSPGVAEPCREIEQNPDDVYRYTSKGNLVAVISNGTAVLGLGDIGAAAGKPVMEGKGVLFKTFADIDVFDLELAEKDVSKLVSIISALEPTFGGINLEDIKAPECFELEEQLKAKMNIPVFHDDQHGTAIIAGAALLNALEVVGKDIKKIRLVVNGAGASAIACTKLLLKLGLPKEHLIMCDTTGVIYKGREKGMNKYKQEFAGETQARTLAEAIKNADVFFGLSSKDMLTPEMLLSMANKPIVFAMANPDPEIDYHLAKKTRADAIIATGRSDYPNQVNNVLGFPYIFRGALDVRASSINEEMKLAAVYALAHLAKEPVPDSVKRAYGNADFSFGAEYLIPKPFDPRVLYYVAPAVAQAAIETKVARVQIDIEQYTLKLKAKQNHGRSMLSEFYHAALKAPKKRIVFPEAADDKVLRAAMMAADEGLVDPILVGRRNLILEAAKRLNLDLPPEKIFEPESHPQYASYVQWYFQQMSRRGGTLVEARKEMNRAHIFANAMVARGDADGIICGVDRAYPGMVRPIMRMIGFKEGVTTSAGLYVVSIRGRTLFFADTALNVEMDKEKLASIAILAADFARSMNVTPRVALLSMSNFGSVNHPNAVMVREAAELVKKRAPKLMVDGEMQADTAVSSDILAEYYAFSDLKEEANVLVFPDMQSGNISYKLLQRLGGARVVGPVLLGLKAPAYVMQRHAGPDEIFNMITVAVAQANR